MSDEAEKTARRWKEIVQEGQEGEELKALPFWAGYEGTETWGIKQY